MLVRERERERWGWLDGCRVYFMERRKGLPQLQEAGMEQR